MLDILKENLIEGLTIKSVKETNLKYIVRFEFEGHEANADLPKSCIPGYHNEVVTEAIITVMSTIYCNRGDFVKAKQWLDKLSNL